MKSILFVLFLFFLCYHSKVVIIENCQQLAALAEFPTARFELKNNIDCSQLPTIKKKRVTKFKGVLDGKGFTVSNLRVRDLKVFNKLRNASLKDIKFENLTLKKNKFKLAAKKAKRGKTLHIKPSKPLRNPLKQVFKCIENSNFQNVEINGQELNSFTSKTVRKCVNAKKRKRSQNESKKISSCEQLFHTIQSDFDNETFDGNYVITNDIDCSYFPNTYSIGWTDSDNFEGVLDGRGHTISGLKIRLPNEDNIGLFYKGDGARVTNLNFEDFSVEGSDYSSLLFSECDDCYISNINIGLNKRCTVYGEEYIGALVGYSNNDFLSVNNITVGCLDVHGEDYIGLIGEADLNNGIAFTRIYVDYAAFQGSDDVGLIGNLDIDDDGTVVRDIVWNRGGARADSDVGIIGDLSTSPDNVVIFGPNINLRCGVFIQALDDYGGGFCGDCSFSTETIVTGLNFNCTVFGSYYLGGVFGDVSDRVLLRDSNISSFVYPVEDYEHGLIGYEDTSDYILLSNVRVARQPTMGMVYDADDDYGKDPEGGIYVDDWVQCKIFAWSRDADFTCRPRSLHHSHHQSHQQSFHHYSMK